MELLTLLSRGLHLVILIVFFFSILNYTLAAKKHIDIYATSAKITASYWKKKTLYFAGVAITLILFNPIQGFIIVGYGVSIIFLFRTSYIAKAIQNKKERKDIIVSAEVLGVIYLLILMIAIGDALF